MLFQAKEKKNQNLKIDQNQKQFFLFFKEHLFLFPFKNDKEVEEWLQKAYLYFFQFLKTG